MSCPWCLEGGKCRTDEKICDFKGLKYEPEAIKKRIDEEFENIKKGFKELKELDDGEKMKAEMADIHDKLSGIKIMIEALKGEFGEYHQPGNNPFEFTKLILDARINAARLARRKK